MQYDVMLQNKDGIYSATVPAIPGLMCRGRTKESTISATRDAIKEFLLSVEWVTIDVPMPERHPWLQTAGMFEDDETLIPMMEEIYRWRKEE